MDTPPLPKALGQAIRYCREGEPELALLALDDLDRDALPDADAHGGRTLGVEIACLIEMDRENEASAKIEKALSEHRGDERFILWLGNQLSELHHFRPAEHVLRALCDAHPDSPLPCYNLGVTLQCCGRLEEAAASFDETLQRDAAFHDALLNKALCLEELEDWPGASAAFRKYLQLKPDDTHHWVSLAIAESEQERYEQAYEAYERALELEPQSITLHFNWAVTASRRGDLDQLRHCANMLEDVAPGDWRTTSVAADVLEAEGGIWPAWEAKVQAVDLALEAEEENEDQDPDDGPSDSPATAAMVGALRFANRNDLIEHVGDLIEQVFEAHLFADDVLAEIRFLHGERSDRARLFFVQVEGRLDSAWFGDDEDPLMGGGGEHGYFRSYQVLAENEVQARELALEFESRIDDGHDHRIEEIEELEGPAETRLGVCSCSGMVVFPLDEAEGGD